MIGQNLQTVDNIRLWDDAPLSNVYRQIQLIRPYIDASESDLASGGAEKNVSTG